MKLPAINLRRSSTLVRQASRSAKIAAPAAVSFPELLARWLARSHGTCFQVVSLQIIEGKTQHQRRGEPVTHAGRRASAQPIGDVPAALGDR
jgi:hypothetical protein